jgi:hypothetical protein
MVRLRPESGNVVMKGLVIGVVIALPFAIAMAVAFGWDRDEPATASVAEGESASAPVDDKGFSLLSNGQHDHNMTVHDLDEGTQKALNDQLAVTQELARQTPTVADAIEQGWERVGPYFPGIGAHFWKGIKSYGGPATNADGFIDDEELRTPFMLIFSGSEPTSKIAGFMYYSTASSEPAGFAGRNDYWHYHENLCIKMSDGGKIDIPYGLDHAATPEQCDLAGGEIMGVTGYMAHVWSVPGYEMAREDGGTFGEANRKLTCGDGTYYQLPLEEWAKNPTNVCQVP